MVRQLKHHSNGLSSATITSIKHPSSSASVSASGSAAIKVHLYNLIRGKRSFGLDRWGIRETGAAVGHQEFFKRVQFRHLCNLSPPGTLGEILGLRYPAFVAILGKTPGITTTFCTLKTRPFEADV